MVPPLWKIVWQFLKKLNLELPYGPAIPLLDMYSKQLKAGTQTDICTLIIAVLSTIAKRSKQSTCPSTDEWIKKM